MLSSHETRKLILRISSGALILLLLWAGTAIASAVSLHVKVAQTVRAQHALKITITGSTAPQQADYLAVLIQKKRCPTSTKVITFSAPDLFNVSFRKTFSTKLDSRGKYHVCAYLEHQAPGFPTLARASSTVVVK